MSSFWERDLPPGWVLVGAVAVMAATVLVSRWYGEWSLWRKRRRAGEGADEPDRVWSEREGGPWIVTFCGRIHQVREWDLPRGRSLARGLMSDADFRMLARSSITRDDLTHRMHRFEPGDLVAARLVHNTSEPDEVPWRIDALDRDRAYRLFGFEDEHDARRVLELFQRRVLPAEGASLSAGEADAAIEDARRRDGM